MGREAPRLTPLRRVTRAGEWSWDVRANVCKGDERLAELFGISPTEAQTGMPLERVLHLVHPEDKGELLSSVAQSIEYLGEYQAQYRINLPSGEIWVHAIGRCFEEQGGKRHEGFALDVTDLKKPRPDDARLELDMIAQHCLAAHRLCRFAHLKDVKASLGQALRLIGNEIARGMSGPR